MRPKQKDYDVGVIVGRFQVASLHEGHSRLVDHVVKNHEKVIIFLGLSQCRVTRNNPLDFESRKQMLLAYAKDVNVLYIRDIPSDHLWSKRLDDQIDALVGPESSVVLYGSRESFIAHYHGRYDCREMEQRVYHSGSDVRNKISKKVKASPEFREGVIWAAYNQYVKAVPTVDVAIWDGDKEKLLLARKPDEDKYRFIGGFANGNETYEQNARREVMEETHIEISNPEYLASIPIDDWRYRREVDKILTILFEAKHIFGKPEPDDDIAELKWFSFEDLKPADLVSTHHSLLKVLRKKYGDGRYKVKKRTDMPMVGVAVLLRHEGRYLLGKRKGSHGAGSFGTPGGHIEKGEPLLEAARNELLEETGAKVKNLRVLTATDAFFPEDGLHYVTVFLTGDYDGGEITTKEPDKNEGWDWFDMKSPPQPLVGGLPEVIKLI